MHAGGDWQAVEGELSKDMATIDECLQIWKLKLSTTKRCQKSSTSATRNNKSCPSAPSPNTSE